MIAEVNNSNINSIIDGKVPFVSESFINNITDLKTYIYDNVYNDPKCIEILIDMINKTLDPFNIEMDNDFYYKTLNIKLKKTNIKKITDNLPYYNACDNKYYSLFANYIFIDFFKNPYVISKMENYKGSFKLSLNNPEFLTLLFNITILWDNMIVLYL